MRIAHLSDLHVLALDGATPRRLLNKRFTGWVNIKLRREEQHQEFAVRAVLRAIRERSDVDHVIITGDLTNLALEAEFERVRGLLESELGMSPDDVTVVPGNHDTYTRGSHRDRRFESYMHAYVRSDLPDGSGVVDAGVYPFVRLRGPVAIIGLSTALPRPPLVASGELGALQRLALHSLLTHREVERRLPVLVQHHPWHPRHGRVEDALEGLRDRAEERALFARLERGLLVHGHLHRRVRRTIPTDAGSVVAIGATSASLIHEDPDRMAGYNLYEVDASGAVAVEAFRLVPAGERFVPVAVPEE